MVEPPIAEQATIAFSKANVTGVPFAGANLSGVVGLHSSMVVVFDAPLEISPVQELIASLVASVTATNSVTCVTQVSFEQLASHAKSLSPDRMITVVHDLDIVLEAEAEANRKRLEVKLMQCNSALKREVARLGLREMKIFRCILIYKLTKSFPFASYPSSRLQKWHILYFEAAPGGKVQVNAASLAVFRAKLWHWLEDGRRPARGQLEQTTNVRLND